ncbi:MAG TPA: hypothetical protein VKU00_05420 [Chthonomonadaceae bacterium]|nr:hypothetical protein [Chthonomonadaceae bacterium]
MSILQIELDTETENRLKHISQQEGSEVGEVASRLLAQAARSARPIQEVTETELLRKINEGWSSERWERYHTLTAKRRTENLTEDEYSELVALTNEREIAHARRMKYLLELANLRQISLDAVMDSLGIRPPGYV